MTELADSAAAAADHPTDTGATLFVEAGAGSGKTSALVDRVRDAGAASTAYRCARSPR